MTEHRYILEPYKGKDTRYDCPECGKRNEFTRYIDTQTGEYLAPNVGICNRKIECGYHYPPKQYFEDNRHLHNIFQPKQHRHTKAAQIKKTITYVPVELFKASLKKYEVNNFVKFLCSLFGNDITTGLIEKYYIGTSKHWGEGATLFWQLDITGKIRTGKIMLYNPNTCKRIKEPFDHCYWVHSELVKNDFTPIDYFEPSFYTYKPLKEYNLKQCFFGEHLLRDNKKAVVIFESEKTAILASTLFTDFNCLACGGLEGLNPEKCGVLQGRRVILYPDLSKPGAKRNCFQIWNEKAKELSRLFPGTRFNVSDLLEHKATNEERQEGLDIGDYLINIEYDKLKQPEQPKLPLNDFKPPESVKTSLVQEIEPFTNSPNSLITKSNLNIPKTPDPWDGEIAELEQYFLTANIPLGMAKINSCTTITDIPKFVQSHLELVKANNGKQWALPYLERLKELREYKFTF